MTLWDVILRLDYERIVKKYEENQISLLVRQSLSSWIEQNMQSDGVFALHGNTEVSVSNVPLEDIERICMEFNVEVMRVAQMQTDQTIAMELYRSEVFFKTLPPMDLYRRLCDCLTEEMHIFTSVDLHAKKLAYDCSNWCSTVAFGFDRIKIECLTRILKDVQIFLENTAREHLYYWKWSEIRPEENTSMKNEMDSFAELYKNFRGVSKLFKNFVTQFGCSFQYDDYQRMEKLIIQINLLQRKFMVNAIVVHKPPPEVVKTGKKIETSIQVLLTSDPEFLLKGLHVYLIDKKTTDQLISETSPGTLIGAGGVGGINTKFLTDSKVTTKMDEQSGIILGQFNSLTIRSLDRREKDLAVTDLFAFLYRMEVTIDDELYEIWCVSRVFIVAVHANQKCDTAAPLFWYEFFHQRHPDEGHPLDTPVQVTWDKFEDALTQYFKYRTGTKWKLTRSNLEHIRSVLQIGGGGSLFLPGMEQPEWTVSLKQLCEKRLVLTWFHKNGKTETKKTSVWQWLFYIILLIQTHCKELWNSGKIVGFMSHEEANTVMGQEESGTILVRFSESILGALSISFITWHRGLKTVAAVTPFTDKDLETICLTNRIMDTVTFTHIYYRNSRGLRVVETKVNALRSRGSRESSPEANQGPRRLSDHSMVQIKRRYVRQKAVMSILMDSL